MSRPVESSSQPHPKGVPRFAARVWAKRSAPPQRAGAVLRVVLYTAVALTFGRWTELTPWAPYLPYGKVLFPLGWLALLLQPHTGRRFRGLRVPQAVMFAVLVLAMVNSVPFSLWRGGSVEQLRLFLQSAVPFVLLIAVACGEKSDLYGVARATVVGGGVLGLAVAAGMGTTVLGRSFVGGNYDPNDLALVGVVVLPLAVWMMRDRSRLWRWIGVACVASALAEVIMSASRGGAIALGAVVILLGVRYSRRIPLQWKLVSVILLVASLKLAPQAFWQRLDTLKDPSSDYNTSSETGRWATWTRGVQFFISRPLTGVGLGQFGSAQGAWRVRTVGTDTGFPQSAAHSIWIQVLAELGLPGLIGFLGLYLPTLRDVRRYRHLKPPRAPPDEGLVSFGDALGISIIGFFVSGSFLSMAYSPPAAVLAGLGMSYAHLTKQRPNALARTAARARPAPRRDSWTS